MNIDFNVIDILPDKWWELTKNVLSEKKFDREAFIALFKETFDVLRYCVCEDSVDKGLIELVKDTQVIDDSDLALKFTIGINDETLTTLRAWITDCWEKGEHPNYDQIGKWIYDYINNDKE